ncbi:hypothetical protein AALP_AA7G030300 [Arabis alpina]|uniref:TFA2 Winged helix domain-containing protein n=1 Tax=Arabis alpina TaxID=50452 RepID=A0A087GFL3_ARAAL|nr:hypothetical protein AALP_AA7G030300 [Arabis alpina]
MNCCGRKSGSCSAPITFGIRVIAVVLICLRSVDVEKKESTAATKSVPTTSQEEDLLYQGATHDVKDKSQLLSLVKKYPDGIAVNELKDAYPNVLEDLQALKSSEDIWLLSNSNDNTKVAYPNDFKSGIKVDEEFKALFRDIDIPSNMLDVEKEVRKIGLKPATNTAEKEAAALMHGIPSKPQEKKKKKQEISKRTKVTNFHLPELLQGFRN